MTAPIIRPLRKTTTKGSIYERPKNIAALLTELLILPDRELVVRCASQLVDLQDYVPTECVLYLVRTKHGESRDTREQLFKLLVDRVLRRLPARSGADQPVSLTGSNITDEVVERFIGMLNTDQTEYNERLDFFELRFNAALSTLTLDAKKKTWRHDKRRVSLVEDEESGELPKDLQNAVGTAEAFDAKLLGRAELRARLAPAINSLPPLQRRILEMLRLDIPIYSQDPNMMTIAKALRKAEKTIRNQRDQALVSLKGMLNGERLK